MLVDIKYWNFCVLWGYYSVLEINILIYDLMDNGNFDIWLYGIIFLVNNFFVIIVVFWIWGIGDFVSSFKDVYVGMFMWWV